MLVEIRIIALLVFALTSLTVAAAESPSGADPSLTCATALHKTASDRCQKETESGAATAGAYAACMRRADEALGRELTQAYQRRIEASSPPQRDSLRQSQRAWLGHMKANCTYEKAVGQIEGPSFAFSFEADCLVRHTAVRICELRAFDEYFKR